MAALWDHCAGDYARGQDWNPPDASMWDAKLVRQARSCLRALKDFESWRIQDRILDPAPAAKSPMQEWADFTLAVMMAWCKRVSVGVMAHGPLLAHARQCGHTLVKKTTVLGNGEDATFLVPKRTCEDWSRYPWQEHGRHGLDRVPQEQRVLDRRRHGGVERAPAHEGAEQKGEECAPHVGLCDCVCVSTHVLTHTQ